MVGRSQTERIRAGAANTVELALELAQDTKFRQRMLSAIEHSIRAGLRMRGQLGLLGAVTRLANDQALLKELQSARRDLEQARGRLEKRRRSDKVRNLIALGLLASLAAVPQFRNRLMAAVRDVMRPLQLWSTKISPSPGADVPAGGRRLEDMTREELYAYAQEAEVPGRSEMSKDQLVEILRSEELSGVE
jgi:hypothetical protein